MGGKRIEFWIGGLEGREDGAPLRRLAQKGGNVVGAKSPGAMGLGEGGGYSLGAILTNQSQQFTDLASQAAVGLRQTAQVGFAGWAQQSDQALLPVGALRGGQPGE